MTTETINAYKARPDVQEILANPSINEKEVFFENPDLYTKVKQKQNELIQNNDGVDPRMLVLLHTMDDVQLRSWKFKDKEIKMISQILIGIIETPRPNLDKW